MENNAVNPVKYIKAEMARHGWSRKDILPVFGTSGRMSEVLGGKRGLSIAMIRRLVVDYRLCAKKLLGI